MKELVVTFSSIFIFGFQTVFGQITENLSIGTTFEIHSNILNEERTCLISLPESYSDETSLNKYPLLILLDGAVHFKMASGIIHFMSSDRNRNNFIPEMIIVAIENVDRERDFTFTKLKTKRKNTMGGGRNFLEFIEKELIPYVDKNYRTVPIRILSGHSLGGQLALNSYMDGNSLFNAYLAIDPSIWWDEQLMSEKVNAILPLSFNKKLYIASANSGEANYVRNEKRHDKLYALMKKRAEGTLNTKIDYFENEDHRSVPLIAMYEGLRYVYSKEDQ